MRSLRHLAAAAALGAVMGGSAGLANGPGSVQAPAAVLQDLLTPQELPPSLRTAALGQTTQVIAGMPTAPWGLQLCSTGPGGQQVSIAGPQAVDVLMLSLSHDYSLVLSARLYRYRSSQEAQQGWRQVRATAPKCKGTRRAPNGLISTLTNGATPVIWIENQQRDGTGATGPASDAAALYATFSLHGPVIVVTHLSRMGHSSVTTAERQGVQMVAARIGQKLNKQP